MSAGRSALSRLGALRLHTEGVAAVEFAMLALPFFLLVFGILDTALVFLAELTLDKAATTVGREVQTGRVQGLKMTEADFRQRICRETGVLLDCGKLLIDLRSYPDPAAIVPAATSTTLDRASLRFAPGIGEATVTLRLYYPWKVSTNLMRPYLTDAADGTILLVGMTVFRSEPF